MNLFLDSNIWLSFYHMTNDDLEELRKIVVLITQKKLVLYLPEQVINEFRRNRDGKIADAMKRLRDEKLSDQFPQMCKEYTEYQEIRQLIDKYKRLKSRLIEQLTSDYSNKELKADQIIEELFLKAESIVITDELWECAKRRYDLGNPPGKDGSYGDAVIWESLLLKVPQGEDSRCRPG